MSSRTRLLLAILTSLPLIGATALAGEAAPTFLPSTDLLATPDEDTVPLYQPTTTTIDEPVPAQAAPVPPAAPAPQLHSAAPFPDGTANASAAAETTEEKPAAAKPEAVARKTATVSASGDPFIEALVSTYQNNPRIHAERDRQKATDESVPQALSGFRPTASATYDKGRQRTAFGGGDWTYGDNEGKSLRVEQPLFRGFGTLSSYRSARQRVLAGAYQLSAVEQQILLRAIAAYMDVVANTAILELARNNRDVLSKQLEAANERFKVGEVTRTDVSQSDAHLSDAKSQVTAAEGQLIAAIAAFEHIVGYKPSGPLPPPSSLPELPATLAEALEQSRAANPQLLSAVHAARSSEYDITTHKSSILPRVSLVGAMSRQEGAGVLGTSEFNQDALGIEVNIPLYQGGAEYSRVRAAKSVARQRKNETLDTQLTVQESVTRAWEQLETAIATIRTRQDEIEANTIALEGTRQEQEYGARTILDVLDAEQELFISRTNLVQAQRDRVVAAYNLLLTLGRLTPSYLDLPVKQYDPSEHYDRVKWLPIGF